VKIHEFLAHVDPFFGDPWIYGWISWTMRPFGMNPLPTTGAKRMEWKNGMIITSDI